MGQNAPVELLVQRPVALQLHRHGWHRQEWIHTNIGKWLVHGAIVVL
jgi:hypothetical protein